MGNTLITVFIAIGAGYGVLLIGMYLFQSKLIYFPTATVRATPAHAGLSFEEVWIPADDRVRLHGWFIPATGAHHTVLFLHGNGGNISHRLDSLRIFNQLGLNTLIIDYRGYGLSTGSPSEAGTYSDARAAWRYLLTGRGIKPEQIIIFGRSLGGAVAVWLAVNAPARALIVESGFTSIPELAAHHYPLLPTRWLSRYSYNSVERLMEIRIPKLVVHSRNDEIVPFGQGRRLFAAARDPKQFLEISGDHNLGFLQTGGHYIAGLQNFLQTVDSRATR